MQYRKFGKLNWKPSALGFGAMRLPTINDPSKPQGMGPMFQAPVDVPEAIRMIRYAVDNGVNYIDSAYLYHGGESEKIVAKALNDGYRDKVKIATKFPVMMLQSSQDFDRIFNEQLERMQTQKIDFYLLHALSKTAWAKARDMGIVPWFEGLLAKGKIGHIGFSFHDNFDAFKEIIDAYDNWTFCQIQYNYMDVNEQAGRRGVEYKKKKGLGIVIMEPLRGGQLTKEPPKKVKAIWETADKKRSLADWALQWLWDQPEISIVLSGMSTMDQVKENVAAADRSGAGSFSATDKAMIENVRKAYKGLRPISCTACKYCMPCPNGVDIPGIFDIYNEGYMYEDMNIGKFKYNGPFGVNPNSKGDKCLECNLCLEKCPQKIEIPKWIKKAHSELHMEMPPMPMGPAPAKPESK